MGDVIRQMKSITQRLNSRITRAFQQEVQNLQAEVILAKTSLEGINTDQLTIEDARLRVRIEKDRIITVLTDFTSKLATANEAEKVLDDWQSMLIERNEFVVRELDKTADTAKKAADETSDILTLIKNLQVKLEDPDEARAIIDSISPETRKAAGIIIVNKGED